MEEEESRKGRGRNEERKSKKKRQGRGRKREIFSTELVAVVHQLVGLARDLQVHGLARGLHARCQVDRVWAEKNDVEDGRVTEKV